MAKPNGVSKQEFIQYAKECLVEKGTEKFTLRAVADTAGVTQGTIYYHFRTKEQLLLSIVEDICEKSWYEISKSNTYVLKQAIASAKSRCSYNSFFHQLFILMTAASFKNEKIRNQLSEIMQAENQALSENLLKIWPASPVHGVSMEAWGIMFNAMVDGLAMQALLQKDFPVEKVYQEFEQIIEAITNLSEKEAAE
ncbi:MULTISPECIES: TetR/AcrR family transcriptional regulator [Oceanobacillus]|uniref:TetR/AcrR family transcriptional regulator n=1 Tax=Oceanobacillus aidingensis TaxID=645964 RepID=A0ABV9JZA5_9BACI|nr:TetR/AcrR family transcriptional regulator [Oceanobacillus oncorhynchi]MDM8102296.1 TetR/AcrR family transcriptional regulator [Oceanobacillus oncorhynchi]